MTTQRPTNTTFGTFLDDYIAHQRAVRHSLRVKQLAMLDNDAWQRTVADEIGIVSNIIDRCEAAASAVRNPVCV